MLSLGILELLDRYMYFHILNNEVVIISLKILQNFTGQNYRDITAQTLHFERLSSILDYYLEDINKSKAVINIISSLIETQPKLKNEVQLYLGIGLLIKLLEKHIDSKVVMENVYSCFTKILPMIDVLPDVLTKTNSLDLYCQSLELADQEVKICVEILRFITLITEKAEEIKSFIENSEDYKEKFNSLLKIHAVPSTGSLTGYEKHVLQLRKFTTDLLGDSE